MTSSTKLGLTLAATFLATAAFAQLDTAPTAKLQFDKAPIQAGKPFTATLIVTFAEGLHGYQNPPSNPDLIPVEVKTGDKTFTVVKVAYPKGTPMPMPGEPKPLAVYSGTVKIPVTLKAPTKLGKTSLKLVFAYQQCNDKACFPPSKVNVEASVNVAKATKATGKASH